MGQRFVYSLGREILVASVFLLAIVFCANAVAASRGDEAREVLAVFSRVAAFGIFAGLIGMVLGLIVNRPGAHTGNVRQALTS